MERRELDKQIPGQLGGQQPAVPAGQTHRCPGMVAVPMEPLQLNYSFHSNRRRNSNQSSSLQTPEPSKSPVRSSGSAHTCVTVLRPAQHCDAAMLPAVHPAPGSHSAACSCTQVGSTGTRGSKCALSICSTNLFPARCSKSSFGISPGQQRGVCVAFILHLSALSNTNAQKNKGTNVATSKGLLLACMG